MSKPRKMALVQTKRIKAFRSASIATEKVTLRGTIQKRRRKTQGNKYIQMIQLLEQMDMIVQML